MGIFAIRARQALSSAHPEVGAELTDELRAALPPRFEAVGEALASGSGAVDACAVVGSDLARDAMSLGEVLDGLEHTCRLVRGTDPEVAETRAISVAWSESMLGYLHQLSCEDPVTGLASLAHLQSRLSELYRGQLRDRHSPQDTHALVVIDVARNDVAVDTGVADVLGADLRTARVATTARTVFAGTETIGRLGRHRIVVLTDREHRLGQRVALVRRMLARLESSGDTPRMWIEGLPPDDEGAASLLGELARR